MNVSAPSSTGFALACPACGRPGPSPVGQQNNFETVRKVGDFEVGDRHVTTSRKYACVGCGHAWTTTDPFDESGATPG